MGAAIAMAAPYGDYNPGNPPEPNATFNITATTRYNAYTSGSGTYVQGEEASIGTSSWNENYQFDHWLKNGTYYTDKQYFIYKVEQNATFEAVYRFAPLDPAEPTAPNEFRLYLATNRKGSCSFNRTSGAKAEAGEYVWVCAYPSQGYRFKGWFCDGQKISDSMSFNLIMPTNTMTLTAQFVYSPDNPAEPEGTGQTDVANTGVGDINGDGTANTSDAVELIGKFVAGTTNELNRKIADVNGDGEINTTDAILIIGNYVEGENNQNYK